ncbi:aldo/keto reductase [Planctopirus limnophila DSM 3776]|uniref:Aldo/keto reductase n=1 Tax=Planctopirus limnophila (strain ATCC 43296 / DSM 3776 / IFAM 1008 / Mu 290) TaxID=521674 RepID=D5SXV2_PLAL2|nr:aldo/keto reductase [Planctopirus limnophila]ADG67789.1 aldo/keto reductase [Planctopirus limnophila DSM 3776]
MLPDQPLSWPLISFGAFKLGRNEGAKYPQGYDLPDDAAASRLLNELLDHGCQAIDTAPAYGLSEERIGRHLAHRRKEFLLSTKVGESFAAGISNYDFSQQAVERSIEQSLRRLQTDALDLVLIHSPGNDEELLTQTPVVETLCRFREQGDVLRIGLSGKTPAGAKLALGWADALMVEFHQQNVSHLDVMREAHEAGLIVLVKKGLASGQLDPQLAVEFVAREKSVSSLVLGTLKLENFISAQRWASHSRAT